MQRKSTKALDLTEAAVLERAKSVATNWMWAVAMQHDRIANPREKDQEFHPFGVKTFHEADIHFLVIALRRLRQIACTIEHAPEQWKPVEKAIKDFDTKLPWLKRLRDVFEHLEDYAIDSNRRKSPTTRQELQVWSATEHAVRWLGYDIDLGVAYAAAKELYRAVKDAGRSFTNNKRPTGDASNP